MLTFPEGFIWGAATSSYQIEGSPLSDGAGPSIWHRFAHTHGNVLNGDTGDVACDHYRRYPEDVALMKEMGLKAYRLSVSWSRVFPEGKGRINERGLDFYDRLVDALMEAGVTPFVTLYHWDLPGALQDLGGWTNPDIADWFAQYTMAMYLRLGDRVAHWITLNEPWVTMNAGHIDGRHAPGMRDTFAGLKTARSLMLAHGRAVQTYRACGGKGDIGITLNLDRYHPATSSDEDRACAERSNAYIDRLFLDPIFKGSYPEELAEWFGDAWPAFDNEDMEVISTPIDFLGVNYYTRNVVAHKEGSGPLHAERVRQSAPHTVMDMEIYPEGMHDLLSWIRDAYGSPPMYITENGAPFEDRVTPSGEVDDGDRIDYLRLHFAQAHRAIQDGVDLRGYFVWSLMDNFEWAQGYSRRIGLVRVDYDTQRRIVKKSGRWYRDVIARNGIEEA